jgi:hypothetical protein
MNIFDPYGDYSGAELNGGVFRDSEKGQYVVDDPLSLNLYIYCHSNANRFIDPNGKGIVENAKKGLEYMAEVFGYYPEFISNTKSFLTDFGKRIPDFLDPKIIGEIKNVSYQTLTAQINGFLQVAKNDGLKFILVVKEGTRLSGPLIRAIKDIGGSIIYTNFEFFPFFVFKIQLDMLKEKCFSPDGISIS